MAERIGSIWDWASAGSGETTALRLIGETKRTLKFEFVVSGATVTFHEKAKALASGQLIPWANPARDGGTDA